MGSYRSLKAWQACHALAVEVHRKSRRWSAREQHELGSQIRRAAFSAAANIAEGSLRRGNREFRRFLDISLGSLAEVEYALEFARETEIVSDAEFEALSPMITSASKLTFLLARSLRSQPS